MQKNIVIVSVIIILGLILYFVFFLQKEPGSTNIKIKDKTYSIKIASTMQQKAKGLSGRFSLCGNCGMIFTFSNDGTQTFWMKDTLIPLDMIWVNSQNEVVSIQTAQPEPNVPVLELKLYKNEQPAKYVIELNAGESAKIGLKLGDKIDFNI